MSSRWTDFPFSPKRLPFFYGWVMLGGSILAMVSSLPGQTMAVGVFTDHLIGAWDLSRVQLSMAYMAGTIASSLFVPYAGSLLDRLGVRVMVVFAAMGLGLSLVLLATADMLLGPAAQMFLISITTVTFCFMLLRFFGQSCLTMVSRVAIGRWFNRWRGRATGIAGIFVSFSFTSSPLVLNKLLSAIGWRETCFVLAGMIGLGVAAIGALLFRDNPEQCGLTMDGAQPDPDGERADGIPQHTRDFTRLEAMRTAAFWVFSLALGFNGLLMTAITFNIAAIGAEMGLSRDAAFGIFWPMAFFSVASNFISGWIGDRTKLKYLLYALLICEITGTTGMTLLGTGPGRVMVTIGYGIAGGLYAQLITVVWPRYFGQGHLGAISGVNLSILVLTSAIGPVLFNAGETLIGSYRQTLCVYLAVPVVLLIAATRADNPQRKWKTHTP